MNRDTALDIDKRIRAIEKTMVRHRLGVVTDDDPLSVALGGSDVPYPAMAVDGPPLAIGDPVEVHTFGADRVIIGRLTASPGAEDWIAPTFATNWSNNTTNPADPPAGYSLDPSGAVHLRGLVKSTSGATNQTIFTLPAGYRPAHRLHFSVAASDAFGLVRVTTAGVVEWGVGTPTTYVSLDGIRFRLDQ